MLIISYKIHMHLYTVYRYMHNNSIQHIIALSKFSYIRLDLHTMHITYYMYILYGYVFYHSIKSIEQIYVYIIQKTNIKYKSKTIL